MSVHKQKIEKNVAGKSSAAAASADKHELTHPRAYLPHSGEQQLKNSQQLQQQLGAYANQPPSGNQPEKMQQNLHKTMKLKMKTNVEEEEETSNNSTNNRYAVSNCCSCCAGMLYENNNDRAVQH